MKKLSIIIPAYNEAPTIREILRRVMAVSFPLESEVVIVDDHSQDGTREITESMCSEFPGRTIRVLRNEKNRGKGLSIQRGLEVATGDVAVVQDADFEYDPAEIPKLLKPILEGDFDAVYGSRFLGVARPSGMALPNFIANKFLTWLTNLLYGCRLTDMETCYKVVRMDALRAIKLNADRFDFEPEITTKLVKRRLRLLEMPISYSGRTSGEGKKIKARDFFIAVKVLFRNLRLPS
ncbi:MAG: glycosyltransferase family 2 protein [Candidatus Omnitrophica bacterium]|nr:glycosyltransferase family 2 protein [Candidatus Omnitrophota bacterium]